MRVMPPEKGNLCSASGIKLVQIHGSVLQPILYNWILLKIVGEGPSRLLFFDRSNISTVSSIDNGRPDGAVGLSMVYNGSLWAMTAETYRKI